MDQKASKKTRLDTALREDEVPLDARSARQNSAGQLYDQIGRFPIPSQRGDHEVQKETMAELLCG